MGFDDEEIENWLNRFEMKPETSRDLQGDPLTVKIWQGSRSQRVAH